MKVFDFMNLIVHIHIIRFPMIIFRLIDWTIGGYWLTEKTNSTLINDWLSPALLVGMTILYLKEGNWNW